MRKERLSQILMYLPGIHMKSEFRALSSLKHRLVSQCTCRADRLLLAFEVQSCTVNLGWCGGTTTKHKEELVKPNHVASWTCQRANLVIPHIVQRA